MNGPPIARATPDQKTDKPDDHHREAEERHWNRQSKIAVWLNWITLLAGIVGLCGLGILFATLKQTGRSVEAMNQQAKASATQAQVSMEQLRRSHRPWVALVPPLSITEPLVFDADGVHIAIATPAFHNMGTSPAVNTHSYMQLVVNGSEAVSVDDLRAERPEPCTRPGASIGFVIFPGDVLTSSKSTPVTGRDFYNAAPGRKATVDLVGCIKYRDEFDVSHTTNFVWQYVGDDGVRAFVVKNGTILGHLEHIGMAEDAD